MTCYNCGPELTVHRWLCARCRSLYTFTVDGRLVLRQAGHPAIFELKQAQTFAQFVLGNTRWAHKDERV